MVFRILFILVYFLILSGCSASYKELSRGHYSSSDPFIRTIIKGYKNNADFEAKEMHDWNSAKLYSEKALRTYRGEKIQPEPIENWKITNENYKELKKAYDNLMTVYDYGINNDPTNLAEAIVALDCWAEQQEEGWQFDHIKACKSKFLAAMHLLYNNLNDKKISKSKNNSTIILTKKNNIIEKIIYFDFDGHKLNIESIEELNSYFMNYKDKSKVDEYLITGHADTRGTKNYNYILSLKRAGAVKDYLVRLGINSNKIKVLGRGENALAVTTPDGVAHPANRRAVIQPSY